MTTSAQAAANRANAQHSTGPKTPAGKARAALNALDHGFRSQIVLQRASQQDAAAYAAFLSSLVDLLQPVGPLESQCVETMALAAWRKRLVISKEFDLQEEPNPNAFTFVDRTMFDIPLDPSVPLPPRPPSPPPISLPCPEKLLPLLRYEAHLTREHRTAYRQLRELQALRLGDGSPVDQSFPDLPSSPSAVPVQPDLSPSTPKPSAHPSFESASTAAAAESIPGPLPVSPIVPNEPNPDPASPASPLLIPHAISPVRPVSSAGPAFLGHPPFLPANPVPVLLSPTSSAISALPFLAIFAPVQIDLFPFPVHFVPFHAFSTLCAAPVLLEVFVPDEPNPAHPVHAVRFARRVLLASFPGARR